MYIEKVYDYLMAAVAVVLTALIVTAVLSDVSRHNGRYAQAENIANDNG